MAAADRTTGGPNSDVSADQINAAYSYFSSGNIIYASHFNYLRDLINTVCGHAHGLTDYLNIYEYGNTGYTDYQNDGTDGAGSDTGVGVGGGDIIYAWHCNELINAVNSIRSHAHGWTDG